MTFTRPKAYTVALNLLFHIDSIVFILVNRLTGRLIPVLRIPMSFIDKLPKSNKAVLTYKLFSGVG